MKRNYGAYVSEFTAQEFWVENYAEKGGKDKSIAPNSMWMKRPFGQIRKCTEAQALRMAFPEVGSQLTSDEMEGKAIQEIEVNPIKPISIEPVQTLEYVLTRIKSQDDDSFGWIDAKNFNSDEKMQIRGATATRRKELKEASVVATQPASTADETDWADLVKNSTSDEELTAIYSSMPADIKTKFNDAVDEKMDSFRVPS